MVCTRLFVAVLVIALCTVDIENVMGLKCHQRGADGVDTIITCRNGMIGKSCITNITYKDGVREVRKGCSPSAGDETCYTGINPGGSSTTCFCYSDLCNAGDEPF
ncbi:uncharacterized protein LOC129589553 [Paramacrobiotus metropolitanus]|uniref:uncharacterized protein LOC129589553 n=1 Tax=Paramacrobiotus metropolitanus TaxID=2943436 RepID=UPI00244641D8|nr:uncharacterized protein LOC129589553 [Paramacrobiotus metropolitanus]